MGSSADIMYLVLYFSEILAGYILRGELISSDIEAAEMVENSKSPFYNLLAHIFWL